MERGYSATARKFVEELPEEASMEMQQAGGASSNFLFDWWCIMNALLGPNKDMSLSPSHAELTAQLLADLPQTTIVGAPQALPKARATESHAPLSIEPSRTLKHSTENAVWASPTNGEGQSATPDDIAALHGYDQMTSGVNDPALPVGKKRSAKKKSEPGAKKRQISSESGGPKAKGRPRKARSVDTKRSASRRRSSTIDPQSEAQVPASAQQASDAAPRSATFPRGQKPVWNSATAGLVTDVASYPSPRSAPVPSYSLPSSAAPWTTSFPELETPTSHPLFQPGSTTVLVNPWCASPLSESTELMHAAYPPTFDFGGHQEPAFSHEIQRQLWPTTESEQPPAYGSTEGQEDNVQGRDDHALEGKRDSQTSPKSGCREYDAEKRKLMATPQEEACSPKTFESEIFNFSPTHGSMPMDFLKASITQTSGEAKRALTPPPQPLEELLLQAGFSKVEPIDGLVTGSLQPDCPSPKSQSGLPLHPKLDRHAQATEQCISTCIRTLSEHAEAQAAANASACSRGNPYPPPAPPPSHASPCSSPKTISRSAQSAVVGLSKHNDAIPSLPEGKDTGHCDAPEDGESPRGSRPPSHQPVLLRPELGAVVVPVLGVPPHCVGFERRQFANYNAVKGSVRLSNTKTKAKRAATAGSSEEGSSKKEGTQPSSSSSSSSSSRRTEMDLDLDMELPSPLRSDLLDAEKMKRSMAAQELARDQLAELYRPR